MNFITVIRNLLIAALILPIFAMTLAEHGGAVFASVVTASVSYLAFRMMIEPESNAERETVGRRYYARR